MKKKIFLAILKRYREDQSLRHRTRNPYKRRFKPVVNKLVRGQGKKYTKKKFKKEVVNQMMKTYKSFFLKKGQSQKKFNNRSDLYGSGGLGRKRNKDQGKKKGTGNDADKNKKSKGG